mmetsp:Transcript_53954/g.106477  ORF Transcript_53954/g.106477 Transcript_53954/m.106477 type:complete len:226 (-) Transcript_53954:691-1368(-)
MGPNRATADDAHERAVLVPGRVLQHALRHRGRALRHIRGARIVVALRRANHAAEPLDVHHGLVVLARRLLVVALARGRRRWGGGARCWAGLRLDDWEGWLAQNAALSSARDSSRQPDVTFLSPQRAPRIFHSPIGLAVLSAKANHQHTMVQVRTANVLCVCEHAAFVELEFRLVRLDCDRDRLLVHGFHQRLFILRLHILVANHGLWRDTGLPARRSTGAALRSV